jgi:hypothetical protein
MSDKMNNEVRLRRIKQIIEDIDLRCMAADGPVIETLQEMKQEEISEIYELACGAFSDIALTCVYCGQAYPEGTPPHGSKVLMDHIVKSEKHPMQKLKKALQDLVGASTIEELQAMEIILKQYAESDENARLSLNAVSALLDIYK